MSGRLRTLGLVLAIIGLGFIVGGVFAYTKAQAGYASLQKFSAAQNVQLSYNEDGQLIDRGEMAPAQEIMALLTEDWGYPVVEGDLDPGDPLVNTASEYMYQMATIVYHTLNSTQTVVLDEAVEYEGQVFEPGTYEFDVDGRYWTDFDRENPIEGAAREQAWTGTVHGLVGELGVGTVTHSALQIALGISALLVGLGATFVLTGAGLMWAARGQNNAASTRASESSEKELAAV